MGPIKHVVLRRMFLMPLPADSTVCQVGDVVEAKSRRGRFYTGFITHIFTRGARSKTVYQVQVCAKPFSFL